MRNTDGSQDIRLAVQISDDQERLVFNFQSRSWSLERGKKVLVENVQYGQLWLRLGWKGIKLTEANEVLLGRVAGV